MIDDDCPPEVPTPRTEAPLKRLLSLAALLLLAGAASSFGYYRIPATYDRRFVNRTTTRIAFYELDEEAGVWNHLVMVDPYSEERLRDLPTVNTGRVLLGADVGADGHAIDLLENDFRVTDFRWTVRSAKHLAPVRFVR